MAGVTGEPVPIDEQVTPRNERRDAPEAPPDAADEGQFEVLNPFAEDESTQVGGVRGLYHVAQFRDELAELAGLEPDSVHVALVLADPYAEASESNEGTLFVHPAVEERVVRKVLKAHKADEQYGMSDAQREWPGIKQKIQEGEDLSAEELRQALALLAERL